MEKYNLNSEAVKIVLDRLKNEYEAHFVYKNASNFLDRIGFKKASRYYLKEAKNELKHAHKLQELLNNLGVEYTIPSVEVKVNCKSLEDVILKGNAIEIALYHSYSEDLQTIYSLDKSVYILFLEMVEIQYESITECKNMIDAFNQYDKNKTGVKLFEQEYF